MATSPTSPKIVPNLANVPPAGSGGMDGATWQMWMTGLRAAVNGAQFNLSGPTTTRPIKPANGFMFFDTTLGMPVWSWAASSTGWVSATGAAV